MDRTVLCKNEVIPKTTFLVRLRSTVVRYYQNFVEPKTTLNQKRSFWYGTVYEQSCCLTLFCLS
ncbi:hypothetical protein EON70_00520 [bacterium]|nr:MAG: hypothetical protein EON70_00520 [bacterium]